LIVSLVSLLMLFAPLLYRFIVCARKTFDEMP